VWSKIVGFEVSPLTDIVSMLSLPAIEEVARDLAQPEALTEAIQCLGLLPGA
jgi:hypothetical protein